MTTKPKILFYDIETTPLQAWIWRPGKQVVRPGQLVEGSSRHDVICIAYEWMHTGVKGCLDWGYKQQNSKKMIQKFTELCDEADIIIGKNNKRFDDKHVNSLRLFHGLEGRPDLLTKVDDLETQMRRHFALASYGLDYFSAELGYGGKDNMCFQDWIDIVEKTKNGKKAFKKMCKYCVKDVSDTVRIWKHCEKHMTPKYNHSAAVGDLVCATCGSDKVIKNGTRMQGTVRYQNYFCKEHGGYAGKKTINSKKDIIRG
jgi:hypothetical protein